MKKIFAMFRARRASLLTAALVGVLAAAIVARASTLWFGSYTTIINTTANGTASIFTYTTLTVAGPNGIQVSLATNLPPGSQYTVNDQWSVDDANFYTVATYTNTSTNAGTYQWLPGSITIPVYQRFQIITTNTNAWNIYQP